jgi:hypothetical protein
MSEFTGNGRGKGRRRRSRRGYRGAARQLLAVERSCADRAAQLNELARDLVNPQASAQELYWLVQVVVNQRADETGVRFVRQGRGFVILEQWDGAIATALVQPGAVGRVLRRIRDDQRRARNRDRGDKNRATRSRAAVYNKTANVRDADDDWVRAQYQVAFFKKLFASDRFAIARELNAFDREAKYNWVRKALHDEPIDAQLTAEQAIGELRGAAGTAL